MYWNPRNGPSLGGRRAGKALEETGRLLRWLWSRLLSLGLHAYSGTPSSWYGYTPRDNLVGSQDVQSQAQVSRTTHSRLRSVMISRVAVHEDLSHCSRYGSRGFMGTSSRSPFGRELQDLTFMFTAKPKMLDRFRSCSPAFQLTYVYTCS